MSFIVIEGVDGSGKATQTALLVDRLQKLGKSVDKISFPSYGQWSAVFVEKFLNGEFGEMKSVDPYVASSFYALDRIGQCSTIKSKISSNDFLISDRFTVSNFIHRGVGYLENGDMDGLKIFFDRLYDFEFNKGGLPKPDKVIFLSLSIGNIQKLIEKKTAQNRDYLKAGGLDIAEKDLEHQTLSLKVGTEILPSYFDNYVVVDCQDQNGDILPIEQINDKILEIVLNS